MARMSQGEHARLLRIEEGKEPVEDVTPEKLARRRARANIPFYPRTTYFNNQASRDGIRHFVMGFGDTNPLFQDEEYACGTKYGGIIAPGSFLYTVAWTLLGAGLTGVHGWYSGGDWEWFRPVYADDRFAAVGIIREMLEKTGRMAGGGTLLIDYSDKIYLNQRGEITGMEHYHTVRAGRKEAGAAGKERKLEKPTYSKEDWIKILDAYDDEELRGADPRWWEDVKEGDELKPMIKGPLTVRDMIAWLMGAGSPFMLAHKIQALWEARHPRGLEYVPQTGERDVPELVHIFDHFAQTIGVERAYDYGNQRMTWLIQYFTNWMGDDGFLWKVSGDLRAFNQIGDITTYNGKVVKKYIADGKYCVDIEAWAHNQRGAVSMPPHISTVILPSKEAGPVVYPNPSPTLMKEVSKARPLNELIAEGKLV
ncbi:MAG: MaoC family dehydratase N-terminal domain-containing protein [Chloroflexi bacterium]|nr:MaoC family dehydratase N-terminal domain-containing protein [Chloroflexota bacterium]